MPINGRHGLPLSEAVSVIAKRLNVGDDLEEKARNNKAMRLLWEALCGGTVVAIAGRVSILVREEFRQFYDDMPKNLQFWCAASWEIPKDLWPHIMWERPDQDTALLAKWPTVVPDKPLWWADNAAGWWPGVMHVLFRGIEVPVAEINRLWPVTGKKREQVATELLLSRGWVVERPLDEKD